VHLDQKWWARRKARLPTLRFFVEMATDDSYCNRCVWIAVLVVSGKS
jgi:hypothetical protein